MLAATLGASTLALFPAAWAQLVRTPERKTPRAVAVLETYGNGVQRLVPVTFCFERKCYDATLYRATPVPFTLTSETVYEVQKQGKPLGTFIVRNAFEHQEAEHQVSWFGGGKFKTLESAPPPKPVVLAPVEVEDSSKPVLHRRSGGEGETPAPKTASNTPAPPPPSSPGENDPDRPKLQRRSGSEGDNPAPTTASDASAPPPPPSAPSPEENDPDRPKLHRRQEADAGRPLNASVPEDNSQQDPNRPILRHGKPEQEQSGGDLPEMTVSKDKDVVAQDAVLRQVAVSDAAPSPEQPSLLYACHPGECDQLQSQARALAQEELRKLASQRGVAVPTTLKAKTGKTSKTAEQAAIQFADEQFVPYDLDFVGRATVVYSARYRPPTTGHPASGAGERSWVVSVVAVQEDDGKLRKLFSAVSDPRDLDLYPETRLVDAVDPEGYGRTALLFREKKRDGVSWLLGRVNGYEMTTVFETPSR